MNKFAIILDGKIGEYICLDSESEIIIYVNIDKYPQPDGEIVGFDLSKKAWILADNTEPPIVEPSSQTYRPAKVDSDSKTVTKDTKDSK
jgi:hypothetical protein